MNPIRTKGNVLFIILFCFGLICANEVSGKDFSIKTRMDKMLKLAVKCAHSDQCVYRGEDVFIDVKFINQGQEVVSLPLAYIMKTGPGIQLIDQKTKEEVDLSKNSADQALKTKLTQIQPGKSIAFLWTIPAQELKQWAESHVDLSLNIRVISQIQAGGKKVDFDDSVKLQFVSDTKAELKSVAEWTRQLKSGAPGEKGKALAFFAASHPIEMVPAVIEAVLDKTALPKEGDSGWGNIYHQAAMALCDFARIYDGLDQKARGYQKFSFYDDSGTATVWRRREVYSNWSHWWRNHEQKIKSGKPSITK